MEQDNFNSTLNLYIYIYYTFTQAITLTLLTLSWKKSVKKKNTVAASSVIHYISTTHIM